MSDWVKCSEKTPEDGVAVLGFNKQTGCIICWVDSDDPDDYGNPSWYSQYSANADAMCPLEYVHLYPTHWQPLPELPPKEEDESK